jgi:NAD(P)-dependent dehydrogenase (short-subunit alcohol dehydrogenase family)
VTALIGGSDLAGHVAVVTGGGNGIGRAISTVLAERGVTVCVIDIDIAQGTATEEDLAGRGYDARFIATDVADADSVQRTAADVLASYGRVDILVNNAAIFPRSLFLDMTLSEWSNVMRVNLDGPFLCTKAFAPHMVERGYGRIVNIASGLGLTGGARAAHYAAAKGGLVALTKSLARELASSGITANVVVPGLTDTEMPRRGQSEADIQAMLAQIPMQRLAEPREIAEFLVFLVEPGRGYVTGQTLLVNGGWLMP